MQAALNSPRRRKLDLYNIQSLHLGIGFDLARQMRRAAVSVPSNVAEGYARRAPTDYKRFLAIANGSVRELETQVLLAVRLELLRSDEAAPVLRSCADLGKLLTALRRSLSGLSR